MNSKRAHYLMLGLIGVLIVGLIAGAYGTNQLLSRQAATLVGLKAKSAALDQEQQNLATAKKEIATYSDLEKIAKSVVPEDKDQAETVREIANLASANSIALAAITFPASTLGTTSTTPASASAGTATVTAPAANSKANTLSQLQPVKGVPGVYQLDITVQSDPQHSVPYSNFIGFLSGLEHNRRTAQVSTITLQPDPNNRSNLTFTLTLEEYIKP